MPGILGECGGFKDHPALITFLRANNPRKICLAQEYGDNQTNRNHIPKGLMSVVDSAVMFQVFPRPIIRNDKPFEIDITMLLLYWIGWRLH